jgi:hypothetical protein
VAFQAGFRVLYVVDHGSRAVAILSAPGNRSARTALMRLVRELAMRRRVRAGDLFLHAAALAVEGRGMLIAGAKGAGKTTLLLYLLRALAADYVSNDRLLLPAPPSAPLRAMPTIVTLRPPTLAYFPALRATLAGRAYSHHHTVAEAATGAEPARPWSDGSFGLSPAQLCALLEVERAGECTPWVLLFPRITGEANAGSLRDLAPAEAAARLRGALFGAGLAKRTSDLVAFADDPPPRAADVDAALGAFAARVHCVECRLGTRAYENGTLAGECRRVLTA